MSDVPQNAWISFSDQLPPLDKDILIFTDGSGEALKRVGLTIDAIDAADYADEPDYDFDGHWQFSAKVYGYSHWMLVRPPQSPETVVDQAYIYFQNGERVKEPYP